MAKAFASAIIDAPVQALWNIARERLHADIPDAAHNRRQP